MVVGATASCAHLNPWRKAKDGVDRDERLAILRRAQVWTPTNVRAMDLKNGPKGPGDFAPGETVRCKYVKRQMNGKSPKFACIIAGSDAADPDEVKVKYGLGNPEVYGEVLSTRLLWALGFGADRVYPVRVICTGCPDNIKADRRLPTGEKVFDPAVIERKARGREIESRPNHGWSWPELDLVDPKQGGAPVAHRDALKLLAVMITHTDNKPAQQRLVCLDQPATAGPTAAADCARPFMFIQDVGLTFGTTDVFYRQITHVNLDRWSETSIWVGGEGCVGNLTKAVLGTLDRPTISEAGRRFLYDLLMQLRDTQIRDLFEGARVSLRPDGEELPRPARTKVDEWVSVFKRKREEIGSRNCLRL